MQDRLAYFLGSYLGDGCISPAQNSANGFEFKILSIDKDLIEHVRFILYMEFDSEVSLQNVQKRYWAVSSVKNSVIQYLMKHCGREKRWPGSIWNSDKQSKIDFLSGLLDTDGYSTYQRDKLIKGAYYDQCRIGFCTTSSWIGKVKLLAKLLGVNSGEIYLAHNGQKQGHKGKKPVYGLVFNVKTFIEAGCFFRVKRKQNRVVEYADKYSLLYPHRPYVKR